jgi:hypothetical protein
MGEVVRVSVGEGKRFLEGRLIIVLDFKETRFRVETDPVSMG